MVRSEDVARHAGVSRATVSLVLNGRTDIAIPEATRTRVLEAARTLGYRPHTSARAIRTGKTGALALILSTVAERSLFSPPLLDALIDAAAAHDRHLLVARLPDDRFEPKLLREVAADGLIVNYNSQTPPDLAQRIAAAKTPALWINDKRHADCVHPDDFAGAYAAVERFVADGHTRIGYVGWTPGPHYSMADRLAGYRAAVAAHGLPERVVLLGRQSPESLLAAPEPPTAALCYAREPLAALWRVPAARTLALSLFHYEPFSTLERAFDTWVLPDAALGAAAVERLLQKIDAPDQPIPALALPPVWARGE